MIITPNETPKLHSILYYKIHDRLIYFYKIEMNITYGELIMFLFS